MQDFIRYQQGIFEGLVYSSQGYIQPLRCRECMEMFSGTVNIAEIRNHHTILLLVLPSKPQ